MRRTIKLSKLLLAAIIFTANTYYAFAQCNDDFTTSAPGCTGQITNFFAVETNATSTFAWDFGVPFITTDTSTSRNASYTYTSAGAYLVTLTVANAGSACSNTNNSNITINPSPTANFTVVASACAGTAIDFTNTSSTINDTGITYTWDFGNGAAPSNSTAKDPVGIKYSTNGTKTITLIVDDGNCKSTVTKNITVNITPVAAFTSTAPKCTGDSVTFTNTGTSGAAYLWDFDIVANDAAPADASTENAAGIIYSTAGNKKIKLKVTLGSCVDSVTNTITINQDPNAVFSFTGGTLCGNTGVNFTNTGTTGAGWTYSWDFGLNAQPNSSTAENPTGIKYNTDGSKLVTFTISDANCSDIETKTVTIAATPAADFTNTAPACTEDIVSFTNIGTTGGTYSWTFGDGNVSTSENPTNVYTASGNKIITLITTVGSCKDTSMQTITINQKPTSSFTFTGGTLCGNEGINFTNTGTTGNTWSYNWDFGKSANPNSSVAENPTGVLYDSSGTHTVTFTVSDASCSESSTQTITISPTPVAGFTSTAPACTGDSVDFTNTGSTGANWKYSWTFGSGASVTSSASQNPTDVIYSTQGIKTVTLVIADTAGNCSDSIMQTINIHFKPIVSFITSAIPVCEGIPVNFTNSGTSDNTWSYSWDFGKDAVPASSTAENPIGVKYNSGGSKTITFTISDANCTNTFIDSTVVSINALPIADAGLDTIICANRSVKIGTAAILNHSYTWWPTTSLDNASLAQPTSSPEAGVTVYHVKVTNNSTGCIKYDSVSVTMLVPISANAGEDNEICFGDSVQIGSALIEGQTYSWAPVKGINNSNSPNPMVAPDSTTTYVITVTSANCDAIKDEVLIIVHPLPNANAGKDVTIAKGAETQLIGTGGVQYEWSPVTGLNSVGIFNPVAKPDSTIKYYLKVTDVYDCVKWDTVMITVVDPEFWTPSAFTPNGDNNNDVFYVRGQEDGIQDYEFTVYNRLGEIVFYSKNIKQGWDGSKIGTGVVEPEGAYIYALTGVNSLGEKVLMKGIVNLVR